MPRTPRSAAPDGWHHVMNRGARRLPIFGDDADRQAFLDLLGEASERFAVEFHAYALMDNHFHLVVRAETAALSRAMQRVAGAYTQRHNAIYGFDGALFRGRYRSKPVDGERYLRELIRYVHQNPVAGCPAPRPLRSFRWTSHLAHAGFVAPPGWLAAGTVLGLFGGDVSVYRSFVESVAESDVAVIDPPPRAPQPGHRMSDVERAVGVSSRPELDAIRTGGRGVRNELRKLCVLLCFELTDASADDIARRYGFGSTSSVHVAVHRARELAAADPEFAALAAAARQRLLRLAS